MFVSVFDQIELNKEQFEEAISLGQKPEGLVKLFNLKNMDELREWVRKEYGGRQFEVIYQTIRQKSLNDYIKVLNMLAVRGNNTAMATLNNFVYDMKEEEQVQKIQIVGGIPDDERDM